MEQHFVKHTQFYSIKQESAEDRFFRCHWVLNIIMDVCHCKDFLVTTREKQRKTPRVISHCVVNQSIRSFKGYLVTRYSSVFAFMLWFNIILGINFISLCFALLIIHYCTPKQRKIKFKPMIKLKNNIIHHT